MFGLMGQRAARASASGPVSNGLANGLVDFYAFDESPNGDRANSERALPLEEQGDPIGTATGVRGGATVAASFTSELSADALKTGDFTGVAAPFTVSVWINPSAVDDTETDIITIVGDSGWGISLDRVGGSQGVKFYAFNALDSFQFSHNTVDFETEVNGGWHHVLAGHDGTNIFIQFDNSARQSLAAASAAPTAETVHLRVGCTFDPASAFDVEKLAVWNRALSEAEATLEFNGGLGRTRAERT